MPRKTPQPELTIPSITARTLMAMEGEPPHKPARSRPVTPAAKASLEAKIAAEVDRLHALRGTRRRGSIVIQGESRRSLLGEAVRAVAPGWTYTVQGDQVVLGDRKGRA